MQRRPKVCRSHNVKVITSLTILVIKQFLATIFVGFKYLFVRGATTRHITIAQVKEDERLTGLEAGHSIMETG